MSDDHEAKAREIAHEVGYPILCMNSRTTHSKDCDDLAAAIACALREERQAGAAKWMLAQQALNRIDDAFEYRLGDDKSRAFIHGVLADYTAAIRARGGTDNDREAILVAAASK